MQLVLFVSSFYQGSGQLNLSFSLFSLKKMILKMTWIISNFDLPFFFFASGILKEWTQYRFLALSFFDESVFKSAFEKSQLKIFESVFVSKKTKLTLYECVFDWTETLSNLSKVSQTKLKIVDCVFVRSFSTTKCVSAKKRFNFQRRFEKRYWNKTFL